MKLQTKFSISGPMRYFNLPHRRQTNAQTSLRIFYEKTNVQTNKKQDIFNVAANQILDWNIVYISFTTSEISYLSLFIVANSPGSLLSACIVIHIKSHFMQGIIILTPMSEHCRLIGWRSIYLKIFISCIKVDKFEQLREILILIALARSEDSDKPAHTHSFARVITARMCVHKVGTYMRIQAKI